MSAAKEQTIAAVIRAQGELEEALKQIEHLPAFDVGTIGFAGHALGNYLAVIDITASLLRDTLRDCGDANVMHWLDQLKHAGELMSHTAHQLMGTADSDSNVFKKSVVDFSLLVERACHYYRRRAALKDILIELKDTAAVAIVRTDRVALAAVLDNILSNAVKYSPRGTTIDVAVTFEPGALVCRVRDEGPGISPEDQAKLFRRGVRLTAQPTGGEPSTGFGLAVAKELITCLGGALCYETPAEGGACFAISLPLEPIPLK